MFSELFTNELLEYTFVAFELRQTIGKSTCAKPLKELSQYKKSIY